VDEEIDLRQYVDVIRRWLSLIILGTVLAAVTAFAVSSIMPPTYEAEASVVVSRAKTEVSFNPNIKTISEEELARQLDRQTKRETLANLASSSEIATKVIAQIGDILTEEEHDPRVLMGEVEAKTDRNSDLIRISVRSTDPEKAAKIANAWAKAYVNYVNNQVYSGTPQTPEEIAAQAADAKLTYDKAEANLVAFLKDNQIAELQRQIAEKQDIIASLQSGKKTAVTTVIDKELQARTQIISAYIDAQAANRLVAFRKEQEGKRKLIEAYMGAEIKNRLTAIEKDRAAREKLFSQYVDQEIQNRLLAYQKDQEARSKLFAQYVNAEIENRLLAFQKEQAAKKALFNAYTKADSTADTAVFEKQLNAKLQTLGYYYASMSKLESLGQQADLVLLDSPAALAVTDTLLLCKHVPDVLLIAEEGATQQESARQSVEILARAGARVLGVVFSKVDPATLAGYHYYAGNGHRGRRRGGWWTALRRRVNAWRPFP
jgi:uncharacterized protein involved in exopolysaccharide biosynthesis